MSDVLKMVEEALVHVMADAYDYDSEEISSALTALRGVEWRPIAEMAAWEEDPVTVGQWCGDRWCRDTWQHQLSAVEAGYTHFCRPILPAPPKREVE